MLLILIKHKYWTEKDKLLIIYLFFVTVWVIIWIFKYELKGCILLFKYHFFKMYILFILKFNFVLLSVYF